MSWKNLKKVLLFSAGFARLSFSRPTEQETLEKVGDAIAEYLDVVAELSRDKVTRKVEA